MKQLIINMTITKSTIGTHVYGADDPNNVGVKTIYIQRGSLPNPPPDNIKVTINHE